MSDINLVSNVADDILSGVYDDYMDLIESALNQRKDTVAARLVRTLNPGDVITLANLRPKYLVGLTATVIAAGNVVEARVEDTYAAGRFRNSVVTIKKEMIGSVKDA